MPGTRALDQEEAAAVAAFVLERVRRAHGKRWDQGARVPALPLDEGAPEALSCFATRRVRQVPDLVARGLCAWSRQGRPARVVAHIPSAAEVLAAQAQGERHVSLVADELALAHGDPRHPDGLTFALHDLCHLEKLIEPAHAAGQRGFFRACLRLAEHAAWRDVEAGLDDAWRADRDYVFADMNGSAIFLFAALKMKLRMAARRAHARARSVPPPTQGRLTDDERAAGEPMLATLFAALGLPAPLLADAHAVSARRDAPKAAARLLAWFESGGGGS